MTCANKKMAIQPEAQTGTKHHLFFYFFSPRSDLTNAIFKRNFEND